MNYVGLFEGISGFGLAFKRAGATIQAVCEIDKTCQSVLRRHHPEAEVISDVKAINKYTFQGKAIDILAGGFPCQDLSVAGLRKGLAGERSGLWFEFIRIIGDHKPRWVVIENVPGLLSSNGGRDFAVILRGLVKRGYGVCWRVFDSQYDGVAQRRNRVFIVASLGSASCAEVLFERESGAWDSPPSREAGERVADSLTVGANQTCGFPGDVVEHQIGELRPTGCRMTAFGEYVEDVPYGGLYVNKTERANTLTSGEQGKTLVTQAFQINASDEVRTSDIAYTLNTNGNATGRNSPTIAGQFGVRRLTPTGCERLQGFPDVENTAIIEICSDLLKRLANAENLNLKSLKPAGNAEKIESNQSAMCAELDLQPKRQLTKKPAQSDVLIYCDERAVEISSQEKSLWFASNAEKQSWFLPSIRPEDFAQLIVRICLIAGQITKLGEAASRQSGQSLIVQENGKPLVRLFGNEITQLVSDAKEDLTTQSKPTKSTISSPSDIPSLERQLITSCCSVVSVISGFIPKKTQSENSFRIEVQTKFGWTAFGHDGKPISDSARYRMLGNAVCVPTAEWIARRIARQEAA